MPTTATEALLRQQTPNLNISTFLRSLYQFDTEYFSQNSFHTPHDNINHFGVFSTYLQPSHDHVSVFSSVALDIHYANQSCQNHLTQQCNNENPASLALNTDQPQLNGQLNLSLLSPQSDDFLISAARSRIPSLQDTTVEQLSIGIAQFLANQHIFQQLLHAASKVQCIVDHHPQNHIKRPVINNNNSNISKQYNYDPSAIIENIQHSETQSTYTKDILTWYRILTWVLVSTLKHHTTAHALTNTDSIPQIIICAILCELSYLFEHAPPYLMCILKSFSSFLPPVLQYLTIQTQHTPQRSPDDIEFDAARMRANCMKNNDQECLDLVADWERQRAAEKLSIIAPPPPRSTACALSLLKMALTTLPQNDYREDIIKYLSTALTVPVHQTLRHFIMACTNFAQQLLTPAHYLNQILTITHYLVIYVYSPSGAFQETQEAIAIAFHIIEVLIISRTTRPECTSLTIPELWDVYQSLVTLSAGCSSTTSSNILLKQIATRMMLSPNILLFFYQNSAPMLDILKLLFTLAQHPATQACNIMTMFTPPNRTHIDNCSNYIKLLSYLTEYYTMANQHCKYDGFLTYLIAAHTNIITSSQFTPPIPSHDIINYHHHLTYAQCPSPQPISPNLHKILCYSNFFENYQHIIHREHIYHTILHNLRYYSEVHQKTYLLNPHFEQYKYNFSYPIEDFLLVQPQYKHLLGQRFHINDDTMTKVIIPDPYRFSPTNRDVIFTQFLSFFLKVINLFHDQSVTGVYRRISPCTDILKDHGEESTYYVSSNLAIFMHLIINQNWNFYLKLIIQTYYWNNHDFSTTTLKGIPPNNRDYTRNQLGSDALQRSIQHRRYIHLTILKFIDIIHTFVCKPVQFINTNELIRVSTCTQQNTPIYAFNSTYRSYLEQNELAFCGIDPSTVGDKSLLDLGVSDRFPLSRAHFEKVPAFPHTYAYQQQSIIPAIHTNTEKYHSAVYTKRFPLYLERSLYSIYTETLLSIIHGFAFSSFETSCTNNEHHFDDFRIKSIDIAGKAMDLAHLDMNWPAVRAMQHNAEHVIGIKAVPIPFYQNMEGYVEAFDDNTGEVDHSVHDYGKDSDLSMYDDIDQDHYIAHCLQSYQYISTRCYCDDNVLFATYNMNLPRERNEDMLQAPPIPLSTEHSSSMIQTCIESFIDLLLHDLPSGIISSLNFTGETSQRNGDIAVFNFNDISSPDTLINESANADLLQNVNYPQTILNTMNVQRVARIVHNSQDIPFYNNHVIQTTNQNVSAQCIPSTTPTTNAFPVNILSNHVHYTFFTALTQDEKDVLYYAFSKRRLYSIDYNATDEVEFHSTHSLVYDYFSAQHLPILGGPIAFDSEFKQDNAGYSTDLESIVTHINGFNETFNELFKITDPQQLALRSLGMSLSNSADETSSNRRPSPHSGTMTNVEP